MINFRFHVVAVTSVLVALAAGILLGTAALRGPVARPVQDRTSALEAQNQRLRTQLDQLDAAAHGRPDIAAQLAPAVLDNRLAGAMVLIVATPSGTPYVAGVARMLRLAGASEAGRLRMTDALTDPSHVDNLRDLATATLPPGVTLPVTADGLAASAALLAAVLLKRAPPVSDADLRTVLAAYTGQGYLAAESAVTAPADAVVVVTGGPAAGVDATARSRSVLTVVGQLRRVGAVVVGAAGATGTVVALLRGDPQLTATVSTVDNVATVQGQMVAAWALADELAGRTGQYGEGAGAAPLPTMAR